MNNIDEPNNIDEDIIEKSLSQEDDIDENLDGLILNSKSNKSNGDHMSSLVSNGSALLTKDMNNVLNRFIDRRFSNEHLSMPNSSESPSGRYASTYDRNNGGNFASSPVSQTNHKKSYIPLNDDMYNSQSSSTSSSGSLLKSSTSTLASSSKLSIQKANILLEGRTDQSNETVFPDLSLPIIKPPVNQRSSTTSLLSNPNIVHNLGMPGIDPLHIKSKDNKYDSLLKKPEFILGERVVDYSLPIYFPEPSENQPKYTIRRKSLALNALVNSNNLDLFKPEEFVKKETREKTFKSTIMVDVKNDVEREENHKTRLQKNKNKKRDDQAVVDKRIKEWQRLTTLSPFHVDLGKSFDRTVFEYKMKDHKEKMALCKTVSTAREKHNNEIRDTLNQVFFKNQFFFHYLLFTA